MEVQLSKGKLKVNIGIPEGIRHSIQLSEDRPQSFRRFSLAQTIQKRGMFDQSGQPGQDPEHETGITIGADEQDHHVHGLMILSGNLKRIGQGGYRYTDFANMRRTRVGNDQSAADSRAALVLATHHVVNQGIRISHLTIGGQTANQPGNGSSHIAALDIR